MSSLALTFLIESFNCIDYISTISATSLNMLPCLIHSGRSETSLCFPSFFTRLLSSCHLWP